MFCSWLMNRIYQISGKFVQYFRKKNTTNNSTNAKDSCLNTIKLRSGIFLIERNSRFYQNNRRLDFFKFKRIIMPGRILSVHTQMYTGINIHSHHTTHCLLITRPRSTSGIVLVSKLLSSPWTWRPSSLMSLTYREQELDWSSSPTASVNGGRLFLL